MEYGSEFDLHSNQPFRRTDGTGTIPADWRLYRSGRDAMKAFARVAARKRVLLPALCCESMILPFTQNGVQAVFYRLNGDYTADRKDILEKLRDGDILVYMPYFGIRPLPDGFLHELRASGRGLLFLEDRTHDILVRRGAQAFEPDGTIASLRKWAALPEGGMLVTGLGDCPCRPDSGFGDLRREAMEEKSRYLETGESALKARYSEKLKHAARLLDESGEPVAMSPAYAELLRTLDPDRILEARRRNLRRLKEKIRPLAEEGLLRPMTDEPEKSGLYLPILVKERDEVQREMIARKLYCPAAIWPEPEAAAGVCPVSHFVTEHMLSLLCDQRYDEADMDYQAAVLTEILRNRGERI